jgi:DNA-binding GntR family transcriptional regulator
VLGPIDRSSPLPAWAQAAQHLRRQIETGRFPGGERLPSEAELAEVFGVSRLTVRQALGKLSDEGLIDRRQGVGTFVLPRKVAVQHDLSLRSSWRERFQEEGHQTCSELLDARPGQLLPPDLAERLAPSDPTTGMVFLKRLQRVDSLPIGITESWVPEKVAPGLAERPLDDGSLSTTLRNHYGHNAAVVENTLETALATPADARLLDTVTDVPLFLVTTVSRQKNGDLLDVSRTSWVGGRVRFHFLQNLDE